MRFPAILPLLLPAAVVAAACSASNPVQPTGGTGGGTATTSTGTAPEGVLTISPADAVLDLPDGQPASLTYKATDGTTDLSSLVTWSVDDPTFGKFSGATFQAAGIPGKVVIKAADAQGHTASTSLTLKVHKTVIVQGAPSDAPGKFGGATSTANAPTFAYPADGVVVPPNMNELEFQFLPGSGNDLFQISFAAETLDLDVYFPCAPVGSGCGFLPGPSVWKLLSDAARGTAPVTYTLKGVNGSNPAGVGAAAAQTIAFGKDDITGGLYYWNAGAGTTMRYEFGVSGQTAETYMNAQTAGAGVCVGCHVVSRDGSRMALGLDIPEPAAFKIFDVATKTALYAEPGLFSGTGSNFFSFSPDSKQLVSSNGNTIVLRDGSTGAVITNPLVANGTMPDWSPDGKRIVFSQGTALPFGGVPTVENGAIAQIQFDGTAWSPGPVLVPFTGQNNYYPAFSPEGGWILFNRSPGNHDSFSNASADPMSGQVPDGELWAVSSAGGTPIKLDAASGPGACQWPKWAPLVQDYYGGKIMWLTFSSGRPYGLRLAKDQTTQLWMVGFDPARAAMGKDPSLPAFWLPFQDITSGNHIAQWVVKVDRKPCGDSSGCDPGEECQGGTCEPVPK